MCRSLMLGSPPPWRRRVIRSHGVQLPGVLTPLLPHHGDVTAFRRPAESNAPPARVGDGVLVLGVSQDVLDFGLGDPVPLPDVAGIVHRTTGRVPNDIWLHPEVSSCCYDERVASCC